MNNHQTKGHAMRWRGEVWNRKKLSDIRFLYKA